MVQHGVTALVVVCSVVGWIAGRYTAPPSGVTMPRIEAPPPTSPSPYTQALAQWRWLTERYEFVEDEGTNLHPCSFKPTLRSIGRQCTWIESALVCAVAVATVRPPQIFAAMDPFHAEVWPWLQSGGHPPLVAGCRRNASAESFGVMIEPNVTECTAALPCVCLCVDG